MFRWPWIARYVFDIQVAENRALHASYEKLFNLHRDLLDKYHSLKVQGAVIPAPPPVLNVRKPTPIEMAINAKAGGDARLRNQMLVAAAMEKGMGIPEIEIIQKIESGIADEDEGIPG